MDIASLENSQAPDISSNDVGHHIVDVEPQHSNHGGGEMKCEVTEEELGGILEVIAATGKFWHEWDTLKGLLSTRLKQVLAEYPEAQMDDQQSSSLGETYSDLARRLEEALFSFMEGPPFTLQRLCEILLTARSIYPKLPKLALALEKNLLVTSTLTISMDPYPSSMIPTSVEPDKVSVETVSHSSPHQNGVESVVEDEDEEMADAEEVAVDNKIEDKEIAEETNNAPVEASSDKNTESEPSGESTPCTEPLDTSS
ncbi:serine/threonine-protein phosphatase 4 regulatory subunit-like protein [Thalictrum thalictroides]|uniref:Serine/threonine-protein phosphatase 4 regulatory subunit-like protein n=1 Tax=Thalictrum thalictroides TaxID=46969 RepID=A0A7J6V2U5_THATH|nr:serine/threonine-protein phosphatase 4 regulatory subunit-like protein [Thalictrum thalictroides]